MKRARGNRGPAVLEALECRQLLSAYTISVLANLNAASGIQPTSGVIMDSAGNLFGAGNLGGAVDAGTVFEVAKSSGVAKVLASFNATNGAEPGGRLLLDASGNLYGTTEIAGAHNFGTLFELTKGSHVITTLATFNGTNGENPTGGLIMDSAGNLYGTAIGGGVDNDGTVFELARGSHSITTLASSASAARPVSELIMDSAGNLYGVSQCGGVSGNGSVFELAKGRSTFTTLASFNASYQTTFVSGLTADSAGNLYGTTFAGGDAKNDGTVFEVVKGSGIIKTLAAFNGANGSNPSSAPLLDSAGDLFGTVSFGAMNGEGTAFELGKGSGKITILAFFNQVDGAGPSGALSMDSAGNIYGATELGGANDIQENGDGVVFELSPPMPAKAPTIIHAADLGGVYNGKAFPATGYVAGPGGASIATPLFTYYLASDKAFSHPLPAAPSNAGNYVFLATFAGNSHDLPSSTSAPFTITRAPATIHIADLGGVDNGNPFPATGYVAGIGATPIATPVFTYYLAGDKTFSHPLPGAPSTPGHYAVVATFAGNSDYLPTQTTAAFSISIAAPVLPSVAKFTAGALSV